MAYDPADLRLPGWLLRLLDTLIRLRLPVAPGLRIGMTRPGILLTAAIAGIWGAAFYSGNNLLYLCGAVLTALAAAAVVRGLQLLHALPDPGAFSWPLLEADETTVQRQSMPSSNSGTAMVDVDLRLPDQTLYRSDVALRIVPGSVTLQGRLHPVRRGLYAAPSVVLSTAAPLGMFVLMRERRTSVQLICLPRPLAWNDVGSLARRMQEGDEWRDLRAYAAGDPLSRIHWRKAVSEASGWTVKRFARHEDDDIDSALCVDLRLPDGMPEAEFDRLLGKAWFWLKGRRVGQLAVGRRVFDLADAEAWRHAAEALAAAVPEALPPVAMAGLRLSLLEPES